MSIFSQNITSPLWVGAAYKFWKSTYSNSGFGNDLWNDCFKINFSKSKLRNVLKSLIAQDDGTLKISEQDFEEMNDSLSQHSIYKLIDEYKFIILICLVVPSLNEETLSNIFTSCLKQSSLRSGVT